MEKEGKKKDVEIKTKSPMWVVILIAVLVIALGCEFVYIRQLKSEKQNTQKINDNINLQEDESNKNIINTEKENEVAESNKKVYTYEEIKGVYGYKGKNKEELYLKEDGTYNYEGNDTNVSYGYFGNYIIEGNKILLNQMFEHGSDIGVSVNEKQIKGTINEDGTISLELKGKGKLSKKSSEVDKYFYGKTITNNVKKYLEYLEKNQ